MNEWIATLDADEQPLRMKAIAALSGAHPPPRAPAGNGDGASTLSGAAEAARAGRPSPVDRSRGATNMHMHSRFSFNENGSSPAALAWSCAQVGLDFAGLVDFDVLDGLDEFHAAGRAFDLRVSVGIETRVVLPSHEGIVVNSPGEPGVSYQLGMGIPSPPTAAEDRACLRDLRESANRRIASLMAACNAVLPRIALDFREVKALSPLGNVTERHLTLAYARKARRSVGEGPSLEAYWAETLGVDAEALRVAEEPEGPVLQARIRGAVLRAVCPAPLDAPYPSIGAFNSFTMRIGGLPTQPWRDGISPGESRTEALLVAARDAGAAVFNVVPSRCFTTGQSDADPRFGAMRRAIDVALGLGLAVTCGTELNAPGQALFDDISVPELRDLAPIFRQGAALVHAHSALRRAVGRVGYLDTWAHRHFPVLSVRKQWYAEMGERLVPRAVEAVAALACDRDPPTPRAIERVIAGHA